MLTTGNNPKAALIRTTDKKGPADSSKVEGSSVKRVRFKTEEEDMERVTEDPEVVAHEDPESTSVAQVPSFYIGKPLVDFDAGIGRVSTSQ